MSELNKLTISEAYQGLRDKKFSSEDLVSACLTAIGDKDGDINSYVYVDEDGAYDAARHFDKKLSNGEMFEELTKHNYKNETE